MIKKTILLCTLLALCACEEEVPSGTTPPSTAPSAAINGNKPSDPESLTEALAGGYGRKWKLLKRSVNGDDVTEDCYRDDYAEFYRDHRLSFNVGNMPCVKDGVVERTQSGRWQPTSSFDILVFTNGEPAFPVRIQTLNAQSLVMSIIDLDGSTVVESFSRGDDLSEAAPSASPAGPQPNQPIEGPPILLPP